MKEKNTEMIYDNDISADYKKKRQIKNILTCTHPILRISVNIKTSIEEITNAFFLGSLTMKLVTVFSY